MNAEEENPWSVNNLDQFLYFCCPECDERNQCRDMFLKHALDHHPKAKQCLEILQIKEEPYDETYLDIKLLETVEKIEQDDNLGMIKSEVDDYIEEEIEYKKEDLVIEEDDDDISENDPLYPSKNLHSERKLKKTGPRERNYSCDICGNTFGWQFTLVNHIKKDHDGMKPNECKTCNKSFYTKRSLSNHERISHSETKDYTCKLCSSTFVALSSLNFHMRTVHEGQKKYKCQICENKSFINCSALINHMISFHQGLKYECDVCEAAYSQSHGLKRHVKKSHGHDDFIRCKKYVREFHLKKRKELNIKKKYVRPIKVKENIIHKCDICNKVLAHSFSLKQHMTNVHEGLSLFQCDLCGKSFKVKSYLREHIKAIHEEHDDYKCEHCGKLISSKGGLKEHIMSVHENLKNFACDVCGKFYKSVRKLNEHKKTVHISQSEMKNICNFCGYASSTASLLKSHIFRNHTERTRDFQCNLCEKAFYEVKMLNLHKKRVHEGLRNYICKICGKTFKQDHHLKNHTRGVHEGVSWKEILKKSSKTKIDPLELV